jgi:plasmid replication initiation protein
MALLPQGQLDLFIASASDVSPKAHQDLMSRCWFSLSKKKRYDPIIHRTGDSFVEITGDDTYGIANIWDNDVLIFILSNYMNALNNGLATGRRFQFSGYEFFKFVGKKSVGGKDYDDLWKRLQRLHHTFVLTNIRMDEEHKQHSFNWLSDIKRMREGKVHRGYEITIPEWMYDSVVNKKMVLTLDDGYFKIRGGLERWLYMFARKASGYNVGGWAEGINSIYEKSGSKGTLSEFKRSVNKIVNKQSLIGYDIEHIEYPRQNGLFFQRNNAIVKLSSKGRQRRGALKWRNTGDKGE